MRFYRDFKEALNEIKRDLAELSIEIHPQTMQDKNVVGDPNYFTKELQNYIYTVLGPKLGDLSPSQPWADREWQERIADWPINPGEAWKSRREVWEEFLHKDKFSYTYNERMGINRIERLTSELEKHPETRQAFLGIWQAQDLSNIGGHKRVPCSIGYWFLYRQGRLDITYLQRSSDYATHLQNDLYLATKLLQYVANVSKMKPGHLIHWVGSLHVYAKDVKEVF